METIKGKSSRFWKAKEVLYAACSQCKRHLPWKQRGESPSLAASCCGLVFNAAPYFDRDRFHVTYEPADISNVYYLPPIDSVLKRT